MINFKNLGLFFTLFASLTFFSTVKASIPKNQAKEQTLAFLESGVFKGGAAGKGFSVLAFKRVISKSKMAERFILDIGSIKGEKVEGTLGYYHAVLEKSPNRLSLDLMQTAFSKVDQNTMKKVFKSSKIIKRAKVKTNSADGNFNLAFYFKKNVKARVYSVQNKGQSPKLVIDVVAKK